MKNYHFKIYVCLFIVMITGAKVLAQNKECDYITSRYYHKVAQAELLWMEENKEECYRVLLNLDSACVLLNGGWNELYHFTELCLLYENYTKAAESMRSLIANYGIRLNDFKDLPNFCERKKMPNWKSLRKELLHLEKNFVSDTKLCNEIMQIFEDCRNSKGKDSILNVNFQKLLHIINTKGFPLSSSIKYYYTERAKIFHAMYFILLYFSDSTKINQLKPILLQCIRQGDCPPDMLSGMEDLNQMRNKQPFLYEMPSRCSRGKCSRENTLEPEELDLILRNIDERRKEIGLPDYEVYRKIWAKRNALHQVGNTPTQKKKR